MPWQTVGVRQLYVDPLTDSLLVVGQITNTNNYAEPIIGRYRDGQWTIHATAGNGWVYTAVRFGDTLLIGGSFTAMNGHPVSRVAAYYDNSWHSFGVFGSEQDGSGSGVIRRLQILDGELYAVGGFHYADGHLCNGIAKRVNGQWVNLGSLASSSSAQPILVDVIKYQGDIYAGGAVSLFPNGENGIIRFNGTTWDSPGGGILGGISSVLAIAVFQGELYAGGSIYLNAGNAGHMIQKWNGSDWSPVGGHLRDHNNATTGAARCLALLPHDDRLLVAGGFWYAGGVPSEAFAIWDGERWCGYDYDWSGGIEDMVFFQDTLFVACGSTVNGDSTRRVAKWMAGAIQGEACSEPVGIPTIADNASFSLYPNPASTHTTFTWNGKGRVEHQLFDSTGRMVRSGSTVGFGEVTIPLDGIPPGLYHLCITAPDQPPVSLQLIVQ